MKKLLKFIATQLLILSILFNISHNIVYAEIIAPAELHLIPDKETYLDPEYFILEINGSSSVGAVNLAEIRLKYDPENLLFDSAAYADDFCALIVFENIDQQKGEINFSCGSANAASAFAIAKIKFKKINSGWNNISLSDSRYFLDTGLGESILPDTESYFFHVCK